MKRRTVLAALVVVVLLGVGGGALARPGGGDTYSGGGGHGGGGGGGGGGDGGDIGAIFELIYWTIRLCYYYPQIGLPLVGCVVAYVLYSAYKQHKNKDWDSGPPVSLQRAIDLQAVRRLDPDFSQVVFEDFAFRLYAAAHRARHAPEALAAVGPYLSPTARAMLSAREPGIAVEQVIVGAMRVFRADVPETEKDGFERATRVRIGIEYEANIATAQRTYFVVESWLFGRDASVRSKPPGVQRTFPCPNCGAPWQSASTATQQCTSCGQVVDNGRFDWVVEHLSLMSRDERPPTLTTDVPERGTELPTYHQIDVDAHFARLRKDDPEVTLSALEQRVQLIFRELGEAWSKNDIAPVRGYVSDGLYDYLDYWVTAHKRQGLRNIMRDMRATKTELSRVVRDRWYHAVTLRVYATGFDYTIDEKTEQVVRGSKRRPRPYTEYWTLIRSAERRGPVQTKPACGNCGAPLSVAMTGACTYCGAHVTGGEFDWVLSKIEQDDSYRG